MSFAQGHARAFVWCPLHRVAPAARFCSPTQGHDLPVRATREAPLSTPTRERPATSVVRVVLSRRRGPACPSSMQHTLFRLGVLFSARQRRRSSGRHEAHSHGGHDKIRTVFCSLFSSFSSLWSHLVPRTKQDIRLKFSPYHPCF